MPIPHDIPLPLPVGRLLLQILIVFLFLAHILFVNLMIGGSTLAVVYEFLGLKRRECDHLAREIAKTITVNKSLAVVLGVAPLLAINVLYTIHFYSANALTGSAWMMIVPLVIAAFLLSYLHKYTWDRLAASKGLHISIGLMAAALFWSVPLIFLANVNLMLFPDRWTDVEGFLSAVTLPNVLPRFLHFALASIAVTGLFAVGYFGRKEFAVEEKLPGLDRPALRRRFYGLTFGATLIQAVIGPLVFFTLPSHGIGLFMTLVFLLGIGFAVAFMVLLWREITAPDDRIGRRFVPIVLLMCLTVPCMGVGRHLYREQALAGHRTQMAVATGDFHYASLAAAEREAAGIMLDSDGPRGERLFKTACAGCHARDRTLVGPSLLEIAQIYDGNPAGIVAWTKAPGKKRPNMQQMPPMAHLGTDRLQAIADYLLQAAQESETPDDQPPELDSSSAPARTP